MRSLTMIHRNGRNLNILDVLIWSRLAPKWQLNGGDLAAREPSCHFFNTTEYGRVSQNIQDKCLDILSAGTQRSLGPRPVSICLSRFSIGTFQTDKLFRTGLF